MYFKQLTADQSTGAYEQGRFFRFLSSFIILVGKILLLLLVYHIDRKKPHLDQQTRLLLP